MQIDFEKHHNKLSLILLIAFVLMSNTPLKVEPAGIKMLDSLIQVLSSNPNQALQIGFNILSLPKEDLPDSIKAFTKVEIGYILDKQGFSSQALTFYLEAAELLTEIGLKPISGYLFIDIGNLYYKNKQYKSAVEKYNAAMEIFSKGSNYGGIYTAKNNLALVEKSKKNHKMAIKYFNEALEIAFKKLEIPYLRAHSFGYLGDLYIEIGKTDSALYFYDKALLIEINMNESNLFGLNHKKKAEIYLIKGDTLSAIKQFRLAELDFQKELNVYYLIELNLQQYDVFKSSSYRKDILNYLNGAYDLAEKDGFIDKQIEIVKKLIDYNKLRGNTALLIENQNKLVGLLEKKYETDVSSQLSKLDIQQQIDIYMQRIKIAELELSNIKLYRNASIIIITTLMIFLWLLFARYRYKKKYYAELVKGNLEKHNYEIELEKMKKEQLNRELVLKAAQIQKQSDFLSKLKKDLSKETEKLDDGEFSGSLNKTVRQIASEMNKDTAWEQFKDQFVKIYPGFLEKLNNKFPELTSKDLKMSAYHKMNLDTKEIASLTSLSVRAIQTSRYRLRLKMKIPKEVSFQEFINQI